jgi:hypothetical protein
MRSGLAPAVALIFVGYATGSDQPERRFTAGDAAAELASPTFA